MSTSSSGGGAAAGKPGGGQAHGSARRQSKGAKEEEAFFVTCDRATMTEDDILNGRLICEIGIAPVRPGEFVVFRVFSTPPERSNEEQIRPCPT